MLLLAARCSGALAKTVVTRNVRFCQQISRNLLDREREGDNGGEKEGERKRGREQV